MRRFLHGFTIIELIVVVGIMTFLIATLFPVLSKAREHEQAAQCGSNLRQIGIALVNYAASNQNLLPAWSQWHVFPSMTPNPDEELPLSLSWTEQLTPYLGADPTSTIYNCPSFPSDQLRINYFLAARWEALHDPVLHTIKLTEVKHSSEFVMAAEATSQLLYPPIFGSIYQKSNDDCDKDDASHEGVVFAGESDGLNMHGVGNNVLFVDGHVEMIVSFESSNMTYSPHEEHVSWDDLVGN